MFLINSLLPIFILISSESSFHFFAAKYFHDLRPNLVVFTLGKDKIYFPLKLYFEERKVIRSPIANGALLIKLPYCLLLLACLGFFCFPWMVILFSEEVHDMMIVCLCIHNAMPFHLLSQF